MTNRSKIYYVSPLEVKVEKLEEVSSEIKEKSKGMTEVTF
jgi:hypothetical protein